MILRSEKDNKTKFLDKLQMQIGLGIGYLVFILFSLLSYFVISPKKLTDLVFILSLVGTGVFWVLSVINGILIFRNNPEFLFTMIFGILPIPISNFVSIIVERKKYLLKLKAEELSDKDKDNPKKD